MQRRSDVLLAGRPFPLGATWDGRGVNFAVFSAHAERMELCLFDPTGRQEIARYQLKEFTDGVWHGYLPGAAVGLTYGYRAYGAYAPERGHRFNHHKLLLDPYARALVGGLAWSDALYGYCRQSPQGDLSFDRRDSAAFMPKAVVTDETFDWGDDRPPGVAWSDTVIYEAHLRGLTMLRDDIAAGERGTFAALAHPAVIDHLRRLGITAIELLPVQAFLQDRALHRRGLRNYWGYNTLGFFTPEPSYLADGTPDEMRRAVRRLHAAGIEVILDVVYNHTAETDELGPTLSFRGLDNASYYRLHPDDPRRYSNDAGTGNTLDLTQPLVLRMVMDSLRHWVSAYHVDGFRFDLGVTLGREANGYDPGAGFFDALRQDPVLAGVKLIGEPWDVGPGGYQLGNLPPGIAEWNDRFRDTVRRFWRGEPGQRPALATRLAGSADVFDHQGRRPWASVNYIAAHDGFTLADVVSYVERHNEANGEANRDGHQDNFTCNWGVEGPTDDAAISVVRDRVRRAMLASVFLAAGTPMLLAGDEFGRTQRGNNNAYCQDNEISWLDWSLAASPQGAALTAYVARLSALRREHPALRHGQFLHGVVHALPGLADIDWFDRSGATISAEAWNDIGQRTLILRRALRLPEGRVTILTLLLNADDGPCDFRLPEPHLPSRVVLDSAAADGAWPEPAIVGPVLIGDKVSVAAHSAMLVFAEHD